VDAGKEERKEGPEKPRDAAAESSGAGKPTAHVLMVVSDDTAARVLGRVFEKDGFEVTLARSAGDALADALRQETFSLILVDETVGDRSGLDVLRDLRGHPAHGRVPMVLLTGKDPETASRALELGASDCVTRPFSPFTFVTRMRRLLTGASADAGQGAWRRVLVIDRDPGMLVLAGTALHQRGGIEACLARGWQDGLERIGERAPDVVLMDLDEAGAEGGAALQKIAQALDPRKTALLLGGAEPEDRAAALRAAGVKGFVPRPYAPLALAEQIERTAELSAPANRGRASPEHLNDEIQRVVKAASAARASR
jgi:CheY-like chemotaxis protein